MRGSDKKVKNDRREGKAGKERCKEEHKTRGKESNGERDERRRREWAREGEEGQRMKCVR